MTTQAMKIVRRIAGKEATVYNDLLSNGDHSIKVWGWSEQVYDYAKKELEAAGLNVIKTLTATTLHNGKVKTQPRLRVVE